MNNEVADSTRAVWIFLVGATLLLLTAALGLNPWPMQDIASAVWHLSGKEIFVVLSGYSSGLTMLFWAGRPSRVAQWTVFLCWPVVSAILWRAYASDLHITWESDPAGFSATMWLVFSMAIPATVLLAIRLVRPPPQGADLVFESRLRYLTVLTLLFFMVPRSAVALTATLHPFTYDMYALQWDRAAGLNFTLPLLRSEERRVGKECRL